MSESITFKDLGLPVGVLTAVERLGYETPTPIQAATIPALLAGRDLLGQAQTGSGKTAAFALPLLARLDLAERRPQLLILVPTRELAIQVTEACQNYGSALAGLDVLPVYGGQDIAIQLRHLRRGVHAVIGTPGRIMDHLRRGTLKLDSIRAVVLDEADEMLRMGFIDDVRTVLAEVPETRQLALFSATMPREIKRIADEQLRDATHIDLPISAASTTIRQRHWVVDGRHKIEALSRMLEAEACEAALIFVRTRNAVTEVTNKLNARGYAVSGLSGEVSQPQRERIVADLQAGRLDLVVATDVAARGLDVDRLSHVFNFDAPHDSESYVHRIGRTGRAGRSGEAIILLAPRERHMLRNLERATGAQIPLYQMPTNQDINDQRLARFKEQILDALQRDDPEGAVFTGMVDAIQQESGRSGLDIAAALARLVQGKDKLLLDTDTPPEHLGQRSPPRPAPRRDARDEQRDHAGSERLVRYKLDIGRAHHVQPGHIVGALTNEGGLHRRDLGRIAIFDRYSTIELPDRMPRGLLHLLHEIRVLGRPLRCEPWQQRRQGPAPERSSGPPRSRR